MTTFTINDPIFKPVRELPSVNSVALQNFVNALNQNPHDNAIISAAASRSDVIFQLVDHAALVAMNAGAAYSNDRGTESFLLRGDKFAIQLDTNWFIANNGQPAGFTIPQNVSTYMGFVAHEGDHSNNQYMYDQAVALRDRPPSDYRPDLTGAERAATSVSFMMQAEVSGWYADLGSLRAELAAGHISQGQYNAYTREGTVNAKLIAVESEGGALGLSGSNLADYVAHHGETAIPSSYVSTYVNQYTPATVKQDDVRSILAYALDDPGHITHFAEEVGPDGTYISHATYNDGQRVTTVYDGGSGYSEATETLQPDGTYRLVENNIVSSYNPNGSIGDQTVTHYDPQGHTTQVTETDGAHDNADYATRITTYDTQGRTDSVNVYRDNGTRDWTDYDQNSAQGWSRVEAHFDAQGREDNANVFLDDGRRDWYDYDQDNTQGWTRVEAHYDAQGRQDNANMFLDDGRRDWYDYDQDSTQGWSRVEAHYDVQGRQDNANMFLDDGRRDWYDYDQDNTQGWSRVEAHYDAQGRQDNASMYLDDGARNWFDYDQDGSQGWSRVEAHYDAQGRQDYASMFLDDGARNWFDYDQDGSQGWSRVESHYDASGREDYANVFLDDGERNWFDYDQDGSQGWLRVESHYDAEGWEEFATVYMDDGSIASYDYAGAGGGCH